MKITPTSIPDVLLIEPEVYEDQRGFFIETYQAKKFAVAGITPAFVQDNHSGSQQNSLRGLHYQIRQSQGKLLRVVVGEVFDVAVDLRKSSPSFGKWSGINLSARDKNQLWIPAGFAHGFYVLSEWAEIVYKATDYYASEWERTIRWNDTDIGIKWPILPGKVPLLSAKDQDGKYLKDSELFE